MSKADKKVESNPVAKKEPSKPFANYSGPAPDDTYEKWQHQQNLGHEGLKQEVIKDYKEFGFGDPEGSKELNEAIEKMYEAEGGDEKLKTNKNGAFDRLVNDPVAALSGSSANGDDLKDD